MERAVTAIELTTDWGRYEAGQELHVLGAGESIEGACVDAQRARQLLEDGLADDATPAAPATGGDPEGEAAPAPAKKAATSKKAKKTPKRKG